MHYSSMTNINNLCNHYATTKVGNLKHLLQDKVCKPFRLVGHIVTNVTLRFFFNYKLSLKLMECYVHLQIDEYFQNALEVVRHLRRMMYHPLLDGVVDKGDVDVDNLQPYTELIGEAQFGPVMKNILKSISLYFHVCLSTFTPQIYYISITTSSSLASPSLLGAIVDMDVKIFHLQNPNWHARCAINKGSNIQCLISMHHTNIFTTHIYI